MSQSYPVAIELAVDTAANWATSTRILKVGEPGYESDTGKMYIGDGTNLISSGNLRFTTFATS